MYLLRYFYIDRPIFLLENWVHSGQSIEKFMQNFHSLKVILAVYIHLSQHLQPEISHPHLYTYRHVNTINEDILYITMYSMYNSRENLQLYSTSHENSSMLSSINLEIYISLQNLSQNKRKFATCSNFLAILTRIHQCLAQ